MELTFVFYLLMVVVAFLYASVGHGGASGYLALMALFSFAPEAMRPTALLLNILVSFIAFVQYYRKQHFIWHLFWPFAVTSIPFAYLGGSMELNQFWYKKILAVLLIFPVLKLSGIIKSKESEIVDANRWASMGIGAGIGLLSGMIGIGGGILLSPFILLLNWGNMKQSAAISAAFIFVNSISGFLGMMSAGVSMNQEMFYMLGAALTGGLAGAWFGAYKFDDRGLKYILSIVLLLAIIKLLFT